MSVRGKCLRRWLIAITVLLVLCATAYFERRPICIGLARAWIIDEPTTQADAVVLLGGGLQFRTFEAVRLYQSRTVPIILLINAKPSPTEELGVTVPEHVLMRRTLELRGIPTNAIVDIGGLCSSTWEDLIVARDWCEKHDAKTLLVPTDIFHTRRVRWICDRAFPKGVVIANVVAVNLPEYSATNWWQKEAGLIGFQNEVIKYLLYRWKY